MPRMSFASVPSSRLSLGLRAEASTGWNEAHSRAANYNFSPGGVISSQPLVGNALFTDNKAKLLPQPRVGVAWSPIDHKTVLRAGFGMYNDLQDALGYRTDQNAPFNPVYSIASLPVAKLPLDPAAAVPAGAKLVPGGVQPDMRTPTLISWSLRVGARTFAEHRADHRVRRLSWLPRNHRHRRQRTVSSDLPGGSLPSGLSNVGP